LGYLVFPSLVAAASSRHVSAILYRIQNVGVDREWGASPLALNESASASGSPLGALQSRDAQRRGGAMHEAATYFHELGETLWVLQWGSFEGGDEAEKMA
jgi:hypothetical protein